MEHRGGVCLLRGAATRAIQRRDRFRRRPHDVRRAAHAQQQHYDADQNFVTYDWWMQQTLPYFALVIAILMVSRIPYPHPLTQFVRGQRSFAQVVGIVFALMAILIVRYAIPLLCVLFVLGPPVRYVWEHVWHRRTRPESLF